MNLCALLNVLDSDTPIQVEHNYKTIFTGMRDGAISDITEYHQRCRIKAVWYSPIYNALMIEI